MPTSQRVHEGTGQGRALPLWRKRFECNYASPVVLGDYLYALLGVSWTKADLILHGMADGTEKWRRKDVGAGGLTAADGKLLVLGRDGQLILAEASPAAYNELSRVQPFAAGTATPTKARAG